MVVDEVVGEIETERAAEEQEDDGEVLLLSHLDDALGLHRAGTHILAGGANLELRVEPSKRLVAHADVQGGGEERAGAETHVELEAFRRLLAVLPTSVSLPACALDLRPPTTPWLVGKCTHIHLAAQQEDGSRTPGGGSHGWRRRARRRSVLPI